MLIDFSLFVFSHPSNKRPGRLLKGALINYFSNLGGRLLEGGAYLKEGAYYRKYGMLSHKTTSLPTSNVLWQVGL